MEFSPELNLEKMPDSGWSWTPVHPSFYASYKLLVFALQVGIWIEAGSRYETNTNNGVAHLLERLAFTVILVSLR